MATDFDLEVIERAFVEAAIDPTKWNEAMEVVSRATVCVGALLFDTESRLPGIPQSESVAGANESYINGGWVERDVRYGVKPILIRKGVATDLDLFTADQIAKHPYYQEFLAPHGLRWCACVKVASGDSLWSLALQRSIEQGPFSPTQLQTLANLSRRLGTASAMSRMLGLARVDAALDAFETSQTAAVIFDSRGNVLKLNTLAEMILDGAVSIIGRRLSSCDRKASNAFDNSLKRVLLGGASSAVAEPVALPRPGRFPILAYVLGLKSIAFNPLAPGQAVALLIDPETRPTPGQAAIQACFSLSAAEAKLAYRLAVGVTLEEAAMACGISYETARNHLKAVFSKTGTHRQPELVILLSRLCHIPTKAV
ncbi:helix-turn-helix transcriptional regulator [Sinorhizobium americanum]|uniref:DNA-binding CsgD family transcriptional regulator n=1 Tax=Sinorhizobium americanum TaxID=194963 RepID=A0A4R2BR87_9HYPH|nr:helix-turn-helix transcriptional regulator [Sinorhizobium americanum]TCN30207.1 DNA-binding CsgD family transcriptional regulator [Sinorhizobium americanum]